MKRGGRSTGKPTAEESARFDAIKETGCIVARLRGHGWVYPEIQHLTVGGKHGQKRRGHMDTIGLNPYSHRGVPFGGLTIRQCRDLFGPSFALEPRQFRQEIGNDDFLLGYQNEVLGKC